MLGARFSVSRQCVSDTLKREGVKLRYRLLGEEQQQEAQLLYEGGWSLDRVGTHFGVSAKTVLNAFVASGVERRQAGTNQWS